MLKEENLMPKIMSQVYNMRQTVPISGRNLTPHYCASGNGDKNNLCYFGILPSRIVNEYIP